MSASKLSLSILSPPRFAPNDPAGDDYLREHGYAVFRDVASPEEIARATDLFWDFLESLERGIRRDLSRTWGNDAWPQSHQNGAIAGYSVGHSAFLWYCRALKPIREIFARLWETEALLVSFDGCGVFRPTAKNPDWKTRGGWYHVDQNGAHKKGIHCYQGLLNLVDAGPDRGGLVVVPGSHHWHTDYFLSYPEAGRTQDDFVRIPPAHIPELTQEAPRKLCCKAGDLILWDSRVVHCNSPALPASKEADQSASAAPRAESHPRGASLERLVAYVCMTPLAMAARPEWLLSQRRQALAEGITTNHWPHEFHPNYLERSPGYKRPPYSPLKLDEVQKRLAGLLPYS